MEKESLVTWHASIAVLAACVAAGSILIFLGTLGRREVAQHQAKGIFLTSFVSMFVFLAAVFWSGAIHGDDLVACSTPRMESERLTRCDFAPGRSVLPIVFGIGLLSSVVALISSVVVLRQIESQISIVS